MARKNAIEHDDAPGLMGSDLPVQPDNGSAEETKRKKTVEEKRADFARLASRRVSNAIDAISSLRHLASLASYEWDVEQQEKIFTTLQRSLHDMEATFINAKAAQQSGQKTPRTLSFNL